MAKKISGGGGTKTETKTGEGDGKKSRKTARSVYDFSGAFKLVDGKRVSILNDGGKLTEIPSEQKNAKGEVLQEGYDPSKHKPLSKKDFADGSVALGFRATMLEYRGNKFLEQARSMKAKAEAFSKYKNDAKRKAAMKLEKIRKQAAALEAVLAEDDATTDGE